MKYEHIVTGTFLKRPNRFLAHVLIDGKETVCHVKNTGRLKEFLIPGAVLLLEHHPNAEEQGRKTSYSVIGVYKENAGYRKERLLINMDSQAPNQAAYEWVAGGGFAQMTGTAPAYAGGANPAQTDGTDSTGADGCTAPPAVTDVRREVRFGDSRFDLAFRINGTQAFMEVKGVTLEHGGLASFPDAPTERGVKHILELCDAAREGYEAYLLFVIQMKGITGFTPNRATHPEFADALTLARDAGVRILACDCIVTEKTMKIDASIPVFL